MSRVLLVTITLAGRTGTEVVCSETAHALRKRKHAVSIYVPQDGATADALRADGFEVVTDLTALTSVPEVIQANQTYPLLDAIARFPGVPAMSVCHDAKVWFSEPIDLPSILRHVAVDLACRDRIAARLPHLAARIEILRNAVDLDRFAVRAALPARPRRALILAKLSGYLDAVRAACSQHGIEVDAVGPAVGDEVADLPARLRGYDLAFASARSALEAMAAGCAVVVIDGRGLAGLVTPDNVASWHENNFGARTLSRPCSAESIVAEIDRYDANDARAVSDFIRAHSSLDEYVDRLEQIHREVIAEARAAPIDNSSLPQSMARAFGALAEARQRQTDVDFRNFAIAREKMLRDEFQDYLVTKESEWRTEFQNHLAHRERELRAEFQDRANATEAQFRNDMLALQAAKDAEFQAYRDWVAPGNLGRRIAHKLRRMLLRR